MEALRTQLDNLQWEVNRLEAENRILRDQDTEASKRVDLTLQVEQAARELQSVQEVLAMKEAEFVEAITAKEKQLEETVTNLRDTETEVNILREQQQNQSETHNKEMKHLIEQLEQLRQTAESDRDNSELLRYRALEAERQKWEAREARMTSQLDEAMRKITVLRGKSKVNGIIRSVKCDELEKRESTVSSPLSLTPLDEVSVDKSETASEANAEVFGALKSTATTTISAVSGNCVASSSLVPMLNQLPPITQFSGEEQPDGETFQDWLEQFESVAQLGGWNSHAKLVNLFTRLRGSAYSFYRSCTAEQRNDYKLLVEQLTKRFTPIQIQPIQSQLFHNRQQKPKETVDEYAEALKKLFVKAYSSLARRGQEAETMGQSVLANQFVAGLRSELKVEVVGSEGNMEQLLMKARFEETKQKELAMMAPHSSQGSQRELLPEVRRGIG